jgi:hypothetical protein
MSPFSCLPSFASTTFHVLIDHHIQDPDRQLRAERLVTLLYDGHSDVVPSPIPFHFGHNGTLAAASGGDGRRRMRIRPWSLVCGECSSFLLFQPLFVPEGEGAYFLSSLRYVSLYICPLAPAHTYFHFPDDSARTSSRTRPAHPSHPLRGTRRGPRR